MEGFSQAGADLESAFFLLTKVMLATLGRTLGSWGEQKLHNTITITAEYIQIRQNRDLRGISCLLSCCAVAEVGGGHRSFLLLQIVLLRRSNIHGAGVGPMSVRLALSLHESGEVSIIGAAGVAAS